MKLLLKVTQITNFRNLTKVINARLHCIYLKKVFSCSKRNKRKRVIRSHDIIPFRLSMKLILELLQLTIIIFIYIQPLYT